MRAPANARRARRDYARGYSAGRRNVPYSFVSDMNADVGRGWGAGQTWLHIKIGAWPKDV
jgi:hypothetical protein